MIVVKGEGPKRPRLILCGEAPGVEETNSGRPFVGTDGKLLDQMLGSAQINRRECYVTNVVKVQCPQSKVRNISQIGFAVEDFYPSLYEELRGIECQYIIPLGDIALKALTGFESIQKHRGSVYPSIIPDRGDMICIPTLHPGFVRELWQARGTVVEDLKKAVRVSKGDYHPMTFNTKLYPTYEEIKSFIDLLITQSLSFSFDIEVVGSGQIACLGIGSTFEDGRRSMCIPFKFGFKNYYDHITEIMIWKDVQRLFHSHLLKIGQFVTYDLTKLRPFIGEATPPWFDTNVAHHLLDPELPHTLAYITSIYTDVNYYKDDPKDEGESWKYMSSSEQLWVYNGKDVEIPLVLEEKMTKELREGGLLDFFRGYQTSVLRTLLRVSDRGLNVNETLRKDLLYKRMDEVVVTQKRLNEVVGRELNVNSPKQMKEFVYGDLGLPVQYHRKTRKPTLDEKALEKLGAKYPNPIFQDALELRGLLKEIGTYLNAVVSEDGRMRSSYNTTGTETGRSSCSKTIDDIGLDLQNVPESLRGMFVPSQGKIFLIYDLWQAEAYCVAIFANCLPFLNRLTKGEKMYKMVASWITGKEESDVDDINRPGGEYFLAKRTTHAADYGLGPNLFATLIKKPVKEAKLILERFHAFAPEIRMWHMEIQNELQRTRKLTNPLGRVRIFRARYGEDMFREAYAGLPQGTIGDCLHQAMVKLEYSLPKDAIIVQEGFDSLVIECYPEQREEVKGLADMAFDKTMFWKGTTFKVPYEMKEGDRWK